MNEHHGNLWSSPGGNTDAAGPGRRPEVTAGVTRGVVRFLIDLGYAPLLEFKLSSGRRVDVAGLAKDGTFLFVEVKSSAEDFLGDTKWPEYLDHCDAFYFAVAPDFPRPLLPEDQGLIIADGYEGTIVRPALSRTLNGTRRKHLTKAFARQAAQRLIRA